MMDSTDILQQYAPLVWRTVYRLVSHDADAADCFQDTFLSAIEVARRQEVHHWAGLLQRIATVRALDCLRRRKREMRRGLVASDCGEFPSDGSDPLASAEAAELAADLREALAKLPPQQSEVFCLRHLNGLSYEEISSELGISVSAAGVNLHRARGRLRELLASSSSLWR